MGTVFPSNTINDALSKAKSMGVPINAFLANISYIEQNPTPYIYSSLFHENEMLARQLIEQHTVSTTYDKQARYEEEQIIGIQWWKHTLIWFYFGFALLFLMVAYSKRMIQGWLPLIVFGLVLGFYPWWSLWLEKSLLAVWRWLGAVVFSNPYVMPQQLFVFQRPGSE